MSEPRASGRVAGAILALCAVAALGLLMAHPGGGGSPALADVLNSEASHRLADALMHGGFVLVLVLELTGFASLAAKVGAGRTVVLAAMTFAIVGAGLLMASVIVDGLVTPAVAVRYMAASPDKREEARALLVLMGATIGVLMPMGLAIQGGAALAWGAALVPARGASRVAGLIAVLVGGAVLLGAGMNLQVSNPHILMLALTARSAWTLTAGLFLWNWRTAPRA